MYGIVLKEKPLMEGLRKDDVLNLIELLDNEEGYPIEIWAKYVESSAMGFISPAAAELLDYEYIDSGLSDFIACILDNMELESSTNEYEFKEIKIWLSR